MEPVRNDPCPCGSGKKLKHCCGSLQNKGVVAEALPIDVSLQKDFQRARELHQAGRLSEAEAIYRQILDVEPAHMESLDFLGVLACQTGRNGLAAELINRAIGINPSSPVYHSHLGNVLRSQGNLDEAVASFRKAIALRPDYAEAHNNLGNALVDQGKSGEAIASFRQALALKPEMVEAYNNLGNAYRDQGSLDEAINCFRQALALRPDHVMAHNGLGSVLIEQGKPDEAAKSFRRALALKSGNTIAYISLATMCQNTGQFDAAKGHLDQALASDPDHPLAWALLPSLQKMTLDDQPWAEKAQRLLKGRLKPQDEMNLRYSLGKYNDDIRQYEAAFGYYESANRLKRKLAGSFDRDEFRRFVDDIITAHPIETVRAQDGASASLRPLFIVGMPRSGTSLTEQILASHPDVFGAGELHFWGQQGYAHLSSMAFRHRDSKLIEDIASQYEAELQRHSASALRVVDKAPGNFLYLGLIHMVFPQARILHTQRNPIDTCLSNFFQNFKMQHTHANDLEDLAFYYREYRRLMAHWRAVLPPEVFLDVPYEALVEDQEGWSRRIIEFTGLEWNESCLNFHETERKVGTPSNWQVRQKIYKSSKERWRNYEKFVGPLLPLLELTES
ncbi:MAG: tetratricopeptide repeat protein [Nitrosomonadales bacterium]|nr:tetratricopeptide repeat protein [Nitrosomonadales bacterium]